MEDVVIQEDYKGTRIRKNFMLKAECRGYGASPKRRRELETVRKAIVLDWPITMTEETALLIGLNHLSQRDFRESYGKDFCSYTERYVVAK